jgi:hypothetical protein
MDPSSHGSCSGTFDGVGPLGANTGCANAVGEGPWRFIQESLSLAMTAATYGDAATVAVIGVAGLPVTASFKYPRPNAVTGVLQSPWSLTTCASCAAPTTGVPGCGNGASSYWAVCKNNFNATWWWSYGASLGPSYGSASGNVTDFFRALAWGDVSPRVVVVVDARVKAAFTREYKKTPHKAQALVVSAGLVSAIARGKRGGGGGGARGLGGRVIQIGRASCRERV